MVVPLRPGLIFFPGSNVPKLFESLESLIEYNQDRMGHTAQLSPEEIKTAMEEVFASHEKRNLLGFEVKTEGRGDDRKIVSMTLANRKPLARVPTSLVSEPSCTNCSPGTRPLKETR